MEPAKCMGGEGPLMQMATLADEHGQTQLQAFSEKAMAMMSRLEKKKPYKLSDYRVRTWRKKDTGDKCVAIMITNVSFCFLKQYLHIEYILLFFRKPALWTCLIHL